MIPWHHVSLDPRDVKSSGQLRSPDSTSAQFSSPFDQRSSLSAGAAFSGVFALPPASGPGGGQILAPAATVGAANNMLSCPACPSPGLVPPHEWTQHVLQRHQHLCFKCAACEVSGHLDYLSLCFSFITIKP